MVPSPSDLRYFLEVAGTLNISRASERLGITQPTLSLAIQRLEDNVGLPLLVRNKSGVKLTHTGRKLRMQVQTLLNEWDKIQSEIHKDEHEIRGQYTIGCHASVALCTLPSFLPDLLENYPNLDIKLEHDLSRKICEDVISFKIDFGIVVNPWRHPDLVIKTLGQDEVTLWVSRTPTKAQDLSSGKAVLIADPALIQTQSIFKQLDQRNIKFQRTLTSPNLEVIVELVANGIGIGILPGGVAKRQKSLALRPLSTDGPKFIDKICLVYRPDIQKSKASRAIAKFIESKLTARNPNYLYH